MKTYVILGCLALASCVPANGNVNPPAEVQQSSPQQTGQMDQADLHRYFSNVSAMLESSAQNYRQAADAGERQGAPDTAMIANERKTASELSDLASAYRRAAEQGSRKPLCSQTHIVEIRNLASEEEEMTVQMATRPDLAVWGESFAKALRADASQCEESLRVGAP